MAQTAGTFQGHLMGIYVSDVLIAAMKNVSLDLGTNMVDVANADTGDFETSKPARRKANAAGNGHFQFDAGYGYEDLWDAWKAGSQLAFRFSTENPGDIDYSFTGFITSLKSSFPDHEVATYDFACIADSDVEKATNS